MNYSETLKHIREDILKINRQELALKLGKGKHYKTHLCQVEKGNDHLSPELTAQIEKIAGITDERLTTLLAEEKITEKFEPIFKDKRRYRKVLKKLAGSTLLTLFIITSAESTSLHNVWFPAKGGTDFLTKPEYTLSAKAG